MALVIATSAFLIYNANMRAISPGDAYAARYLPLSIWRHQSLHLDPVVELTAQGRRLPDKPHETTEAYWIVKGPDGHFAPRYPILLPLAVTPLYAPAAVYLHAHNWEGLHRRAEFKNVVLDRHDPQIRQTDVIDADRSDIVQRCEIISQIGVDRDHIEKSIVVTP